MTDPVMDVIHLRGTSEVVTIGSGVSGTFLAALDHTRFHPVVIDYPAEFGTPESWVDSRAQGRAAAIAAIRQTANRVVLSGYSQGAGIAGDLAAEIATGQHPELQGLEVSGCALIADPSRPENVGVGVIPPGYGVCGQRPIRLPAFWVGVTGDPITALAPNSLLRALPDLIQYWGLRSPAEVVAWVKSLVNILTDQQYERWLAGDPTWQECLDGIGELNAFLLGGKHTDSYVAQGLCVLLAQTLNKAAL